MPWYKFFFREMKLKKYLFEEQFMRYFLVILVLVLNCQATGGAATAGRPGKGESQILPFRSEKSGGWIPLPSKPQIPSPQTLKFKATFRLPFERFPQSDLERSWELRRRLTDERNALHLHHQGKTGSRAHMGRRNNIGKMDHSIHSINNQAGTQNHSPQTWGLGEGMKNILQRSNHRTVAHAESHAGGMDNPFFEQLQRFTTLQLFPEAAMGVSLAGHGTEMWAQYQVGTNACLTLDLQHDMMNPQGRLSLAMDM